MAAPLAVIPSQNDADPSVDYSVHPSGIIPTLQNIVSTVNLGCPLDLKKIALKARNAEYNPKVKKDRFHSQLVVRFSRTFYADSASRGSEEINGGIYEDEDVPSLKTTSEICSVENSSLTVLNIENSSLTVLKILH
jgi:hypothetical protein